MFFAREDSIGLIESQDGLKVTAGSSHERLSRAGIVPGQFLAIASPDWSTDGAQEFILARFLQVTARRDDHTTTCKLHCRVMGNCRVDQRTGKLSYYAGLPAYGALMLTPFCACHMLPEPIMRALLALSGDIGETFELGHVRWGEHTGKPAHSIPWL